MIEHYLWVALFTSIRTHRTSSSLQSIILYPFLIFGGYTALESDEYIRSVEESCLDQLRLRVTAWGDLTLERIRRSSYTLYNKPFSLLVYLTVVTKRTFE